MDNQIERYQHNLLFYFQKDKNVVQAQKKLCDMHNED